jgi:DNA-binding NarL/FixJ family response regulator
MTEATATPVTVVIAEDQALLRDTFRMLIDSCPDLTTVGEADTGIEAVDLAKDTHPDVILMDIRMPRLDGIEATRLICGTPDTERTRVIILTTFDLDEYVYAALRAGASGFLLKDTPAAGLLTAIRVVAAGEALLAPTITRRLISEFTRRPRPGHIPVPELAMITGREREVLTLIGHGLTNQEIAEHLHISPATARTHVGHLLTKLTARDRAQLVIAAYETGLVTPGSPHQ